jgi:uncharacterized protein (DUF305 family)
VLGRTDRTITPSLVNVAPPRHRPTAVAWLLLLVGGCATSPRTSPPAPVTPAPAAAPAPAPSAARSASAAASAHDEHAQHDMGTGKPTIPAGALYTEADVRFMQGMIAHHAQAIHMSRMAPSHGASARLTRFAHKIDLSQAGEIVLMQEWLRANGQVAPDTSAWRTMTMHGMLTAEELARLDAARGPAFDRLFLEFMIRHHEGALKMVADLFATPRAGQDVDVSVLANDVETTQTAEIGLMRQMLTEL